MADNVAITAGSGTTIATDDCGAGGHTQIVKLAYSADGVATLCQVDSNGMLVSTGLNRAEDAAHVDGHNGVMLLGVRNYAGPGTDGDYSAISVNSEGFVKSEIHKDLQRIAVQISGLTTASTNYTAGDQCGDQLTFANAARNSNGSGRIIGVTLICATDNGGAYDLVVTDSSITLASNNAAYAISDSDALKIVTLIPLAAAYDIGNNRIALAQNINIPYVCNGGTSLFGGLIIRSSGFVFGASTDITVVMYVERD